MLRMFIYDIIALMFVVLFLLTFVYIVKDRKGREKGITIVWCIINFCIPIMGFLGYCLWRQFVENKNK